MFSTLLIANRGEIACRIIRTAQKHGLRTIAVYSEADRESLHVHMADEAIYLGAAEATQSYLNIDAIIHAAKASNAEAIHPGYGFLSENPAFARACAAHDLIFVGPPVAAMELMASKQRAKQCLEKTSVPLTPGYHGESQDDEDLLKAARKIGFPILLKAAAGGGGKGMRSVTDEEQFKNALASARREAQASFGDDTMLIEKQIMNPRHVEMQIMSDNHGNTVHLFDRDCSIQRRHQKIIEEAPAPNLSQKLRDALAEAAITVAKTIDYRGAGTIEFLVADDEQFYFMEMNTRLQVEHPVTEMITGLDLVHWQLLIAAGKPLPLQQNNIQSHGHALECRVYAEDSEQGGLPSTGTLRVFEEPTGPAIRVDAGFLDHATITRFYDPMLSKLIVWGETRDEALQRMQQALTHYHLGGVKTNLTFLHTLISHPAFQTVALSTDFLDQTPIKPPKISLQHTLLLAAAHDFLESVQKQDDPMLYDTYAWQSHEPLTWPLYYQCDDVTHTVHLTPITTRSFTLKHEGVCLTVQAERPNKKIMLDDGTQKLSAWSEVHDQKYIFYTTNGHASITRLDNPIRQTSGNAAHHALTAPMPSTVVAILKTLGEQVKAGDDLLVLEAMKMEHTIRAPEDGHVSEIFYSIGAQVNEGMTLIAISPLDTNTPQSQEA
ncbi:MAG: acetyl-CoA carboxylase biotin carboxylase subunit [Legionellaceae bacterium]|nr:acetyl-CoA carboxylase biotin carboxylase subunit [Legionellaceae bacterium]